MASGADVLNAARQFIGEPYSTAPGRTSPTSGYKDCSGLIAAAYKVATGEDLGAYVSVTIFELCRDAGLEISWEQAINIPGALFFCPDDPTQGWGDNGHIGFSAGDGSTVEATPPRVQSLSIWYQPWSKSHAALLPGIDYGITPQAPAPGSDVISVGSTGDAVRTWQQRINDAGCGPVDVDGDFGPATETGAKCLQTKLGIDADGQIGPQTAAAWAAANTPPPDAGVLQTGSTGAAVTAWQHDCNLIGCGPIDEDGDFGPATDAATRCAQDKLHVDVDGQVGSQTLAAFAAWSAPTPPVVTPSPVPTPTPEPTPTPTPVPVPPVVVPSPTPVPPPPTPPLGPSHGTFFDLLALVLKWIIKLLG